MGIVANILVPPRGNFSQSKTPTIEAAGDGIFKSVFRQQEHKHTIDNGCLDSEERCMMSVM